MGRAGKKPDIEDRCFQIRAQIEQTKSDCDRGKLRERLARWAGGVAVIRVGAPSESEMKSRQGPCHLTVGRGFDVFQLVWPSRRQPVGFW